MKTVFQLVLAALAVVVVCLVGLGLAFPSRWHVERSLLINADPTTIHELVSDLHTWPEWADPAVVAQAEFSYTGPERGAGAAREWQDARGVKGRTEITREEAAKGIWFRSIMDEGNTKTSGAIVYEASAAGTNVTWRDEGDLPRPFGLYFRDGVERDISALFDQGLLRLKRLAEERARGERSDQAQVK